VKESWHVDRQEAHVNYWKEETFDPPSSFHRSLRCVEFFEGGKREIEVDVAKDELMSILLDGRVVGQFLALPTQLLELAQGFLICEGLIEGLYDLKSIYVDEGIIDCRVKNGRNYHASAPSKDIKPIRSQLKMKKSRILKAIDKLDEGAKLWRRTGGTHSSLIIDHEGRAIAFCEDVSRSCSLDKAVGKALSSGADLSNCALITTGRLSSVMVSKAARAKIPILVSRAAPLCSGIELANKVGMTLVAFARGVNLYVYAHDERVLYDYSV